MKLSVSVFEIRDKITEKIICIFDFTILAGGSKFAVSCLNLMILQDILLRAARRDDSCFSVQLLSLRTVLPSNNL
jgi:hypothetical protein